MYSRKISVRYGTRSGNQPCPLKWLDNFAMRNFTNDPIFDDTLPVSEGLMEIGAKVPLERLQTAMEEWFRKKSYLKPGEDVLVQQVNKH
ncbi:MAG: hypothetical protein ACM3SW_03825 [Actinomycetota bacterium]